MRVLDLITDLANVDRRIDRLHEDLAVALADRARLGDLLTRLLRSRGGRPILGFSAYAALEDGVAVVHEADYAHDVFVDETAMPAAMTGHPEVDGSWPPNPGEMRWDANGFPREATPEERKAMSVEAWSFWHKMREEAAR